LLANLYMRRFVLGWKAQGHGRRLQAHIVNYADDFVICCRGTADEAMTVMRSMMVQLKLTVNETKTRLCRVPDETFDFLGYTFGRCYSPKTGEAYLGMRPSAKKIRAICAALSEQTQRRWFPGAGGPGPSSEPHAAGLGELFLSVCGGRSLSRRGYARLL
jgi:RNA-directed DNA polymerase